MLKDMWESISNTDDQLECMDYLLLPSVFLNKSFSKQYYDLMES
jgi:hypothetical protein